MQHSKKEVADAIKHAISKGWTVKEGGSHAWGQMYCPHNSEDCRCGAFCRFSISSTPKNAGNHAKQIRRVVDNCKFEKLSDYSDTGEE